MGKYRGHSRHERRLRAGTQNYFMETSQDSLVTIFGGALFDPIADLIFKLKEFPEPPGNEVQTPSIINGYACAICLLTVAALESYVMRVRHINKNIYPIDRSTCSDFLSSLYPDFTQKDVLTEIFILRDIITHNHLWNIDFTWDEEIGMRLDSATLDPNSGDKKYKDFVDKNSLKTKNLKLSVIPIKIGKNEVITVLSEVGKVLSFLENKNPTCAISHCRTKKGDDLVSISDLFSDAKKYIC